MLGAEGLEGKSLGFVVLACNELGFRFGLWLYLSWTQVQIHRARLMALGIRNVGIDQTRATPSLEHRHRPRSCAETFTLNPKP